MILNNENLMATRTQVDFLEAKVNREYFKISEFDKFF